MNRGQIDALKASGVEFFAVETHKGSPRQKAHLIRYTSGMQSSYGHWSAPSYWEAVVWDNVYPSEELAWRPRNIHGRKVVSTWDEEVARLGAEESGKEEREKGARRALRLAERLTLAGVPAQASGGRISTNALDDIEKLLDRLERGMRAVCVSLCA